MYTKQSLASKSVQNNRNIYQKSNRNQDHKRNHRSQAMRAPTRQRPKLDLNHIHQCQHQKPASANRTHTGYQHPHPKSRFVNVDQELEWVVEGGVSRESNGLFESQGDETGEEEGAERVDMERDQVLGDRRTRIACRIWVERVVGISGVPG
ncbi:hypothetical protein O6P43_011957 [Quillaja saponaria]|uniref:Uncharacterized protein n=1 Tax=Quillaja saponaria TaxID=32244 RepID=A0AAD7PTV6_QUISA|nr:hypothetical protein O6P43_011957 [Quillaja saponaria]